MHDLGKEVDSEKSKHKGVSSPRGRVKCTGDVFHGTLEKLELV